MLPQSRYKHDYLFLIHEFVKFAPMRYNSTNKIERNAVRIDHAHRRQARLRRDFIAETQVLALVLIMEKRQKES